MLRKLLKLRYKIYRNQRIRAKPMEMLFICFLFFLVFFNFSLLWPRQESNLDLELRKLLYYPLYYEAIMMEPFYVPKAAILLPNILTAIAINITPKNFLITINPLGPKTLSTHLRDFKTIKIITQLIKIPSKIFIP